MGVVTIGVIDKSMEDKKQQEDRERRPLDEFIDWF